jgi:glucosamine--fructose-6-phosphate aminotransferase (isomerizing)
MARRPGGQVHARGAGAGAGGSRLRSEYRYRNPIVAENELAIVITQSGETADTRAALHEAARKGASSIAICNVVGSAAPRDADGTVYTHAGPEIGVASTKAFTSQLVALQLLGSTSRRCAARWPEEIRGHIDELLQLPQTIEQAIKASAPIEKVGERSTTAPTSCSSAAASTIRSRSKAR